MRVTIRVSSGPFEGDDDCLTAAADWWQDHAGLTGWDLSPRWEDDRNREVILLDVPPWAVEGGGA